MAEPETPPEEAQDDVDALEKPEGTAGADGVIDATQGAAEGTSAPTATTPAVPPKKGGLKQLFKRFNIYFLLFLFILVMAGVILTIAYFQSKKASTSNIVKTQELTENALKQLANSDASIGSTEQVLTIQSSAIFSGKVLVREGLEAAGTLKVSGTTALNDLVASGSSQFGDAQINKKLSVAGDTALQGSASIAKGLQVKGDATFGGPISAPQVTTTNLQLNGDLILTHHFVAGGPTPVLARGSALGGGGTASVDGSDTSGTVTVNVGAGAPAGCFATVTFARKYSSTPRVLLTPVGSDGGTINYYVNRSATNFSICTSTPPPTGSFGFDYFVAG